MSDPLERACLDVWTLLGCPDVGAPMVEYIGPKIQEYGREREQLALERAMKVCENPYSDEVQAYGDDEPSVVARKIKAAIRGLMKEGDR